MLRGALFHLSSSQSSVFAPEISPTLAACGGAANDVRRNVEMREWVSGTWDSAIEGVRRSRRGGMCMILSLAAGLLARRRQRGDGRGETASESESRSKGREGVDVDMEGGRREGLGRAEFQRRRNAPYVYDARCLIPPFALSLFSIVRMRALHLWTRSRVC